MSYFGASQRMVGDPGFFGTLGRIARGVGRAGVGFLTGGAVGAATSIAGDIFRPPRGGGGITQVPVTRVPGIKGAAQRLIPGGATGFEVAGMRRKRRRMNPMNKKALTRANRRIDGFVRETRKVLKHTNYKLVTKQSRSRPKKDMGPGHTHVR